MSSSGRLGELISNDLLRPVRPQESRPVLRELYLAREVQALVDRSPGIRRSWHEVAGQAAFYFDEFVAGEEVSFGMDPDDHLGALIARNKPLPDGICDFRIMTPAPAIRVFGAFRQRDQFIALTYQLRRGLTGLPFFNAVARARKSWNTLFPGEAPLVSQKVEDYVGHPFVAV